ncbi:MAG: response regulator, partial [Pseudogulbenkiania sp.]|nr:response regulator [Pseudogulbenkiania sp.]
MLGRKTIKPIGVGGKLTLSFCILVGLTLLVVTLAFIAGHRATEDIKLTEGVRGPASLASAQAQASLLRMQLHLRGYLVLSDPEDVVQYQNAKRSFEKSLTSLQAMSTSWNRDEEGLWVAELTEIYQHWVKLPPQLFDLHDNPLKNRPALRLARFDVQALRVRILDQIDTMIGLQKGRESTPQNRELLADLLGFQGSFDAMATNLMAYAASGELNFKLAYGPQLATNAVIWNALARKHGLFSAEQRARLDAIARHRSEVAELALKIVGILSGEHGYEDLYLYRTEVIPPAEAMKRLLEEATARQQAQLQTDLARARQSLADAQLQTVVGGMLAVVFGIAMVFVLRRNIVGPVQRLTGVAERVAAGDLSARAVVEARDEIGVLASSFNTMTQRLAETIEHLEIVFAEARLAKDASEMANRAKSLFLANMSHELRTPLNGILGYAQVLQRDKMLGDRQIARLNVIQQSGEHLLTLINDILDLAKIEAGKLELSVSDMSLASFLYSIAEVIRVRAEQKGLDFVCDMAPDLPGAIRADERRLRQVLLNLLANAVNFTDSGRVSLYVGVVPRNRLRFEVRDTGIGIGEDQLEAVFQPFEQAGAARRPGGTGLGLAISRQFVRLMGSDIQVESRVGQGSTFRFDVEVPVVMAEPMAAGAARVVTGYEGPRLRVLVVDDVAENRAVVIDMLEPLGFAVVEAANGREGVVKAQTRRPQLILMDLLMPEMDGLEAAYRLRQLPGLENVPIIMISASASGSDKEASLAAGANAFLPKPIDLGRLLSQISLLLTLDWTYTTPETRAAQAGPLVVPPAQEIEILHHLARLGNMRDILQRASHLAELDERYRPFAGQLSRLAQGYQSKAILSLVEQFLERKPS